MLLSVPVDGILILVFIFADSTSYLVWCVFDSHSVMVSIIQVEAEPFLIYMDIIREHNEVKKNIICGKMVIFYFKKFCWVVSSIVKEGKSLEHKKIKTCFLKVLPSLQHYFLEGNWILGWAASGPGHHRSPWLCCQVIWSACSWWLSSCALVTWHCQGHFCLLMSASLQAALALATYP